MSYYIDWNKIPGGTPLERLKYFLNSLQEVADADISLEEGVQYSEIFDSILQKAIKVGDPRLVQIILNELIKKIPQTELPNYDLNLVLAFFQALKLGNSQIIEILLPYYDSTKRIRSRSEYDPQILLHHVLMEALREKDLKLVERIEQYTEFRRARL